MRLFRPLFAAALACLPLSLVPVALPAQERAQSILILDASGSMWGQIDGTAKITIAQSVVSDLMESLPEDQALGLTAYGHREKGDCADIETLIQPGGGRDAIIEAVNGLTPRGKTPMTDAVIAAAQTLRYTEEKATVILVSDGIETCHPDPCAAARELEAAGVDFTAHVIGFDIDDPEAIAQMQCLANETGGRFLSASNAAELGTALAAVAEEPAPVTVTFRALAGDGGPQIDKPLIWEVLQGDTALVDFERGATITADLVPGDYTASVLRPEDEATAETGFTVESADQTVTLVLPAPLPEATLEAADSAPVGSRLSVAWEGPGAERDYITVSVPGEGGYVNYTYTRDGSPLDLLMPPEPGRYELRYVRQEGDVVLATRPIEVTPVEATVAAPSPQPAGATVAVDWTGPDYERDYITVSKAGERGYVNYTYTRDGSPLDLVMPAEPGEYEIRYVMQQGDTVLAVQPMVVEPVAATLDAPDTALVGEPLSVGWTGPDYERDYLTVAVPGEGGYINYTYTRDGTPLDLEMPTEPGDYELRYVMQQGDTVLATRAITVTEVTATLDAPQTAQAGEPLAVTWEGPNYERDYLTVSRVGEDGYINYTYTRDGSPAPVLMPLEPGAYELRYVMQQGDTVLAARPIEVVAVEASVTAPATARAGAAVIVDWEGPGYERDYIALSQMDDDAGRQIHYTYTREGSPLLLRLPSEPGTYEVRYVAQANGDAVLARQEIVAEEVTATLTAPAEVRAGGNLAIEWEGPDFAGDYIGLYKEGEDRARVYKRTHDDSPMILQTPEGPGRYELRYVMGQDDRVLARQTVELTYEPE